jgi:hypothetical protein
MKVRTPETGPILAERIIRLAINMHGKLGRGVLESVDHPCPCWDFHRDGRPLARRSS